jgi:TrmH family RNA methyltransferase
MFVAEGPKLVNDLVACGMVPQLLLTTDGRKTEFPHSSENIEFVSETELKKFSFLKTPQKVVAVFKKPQWHLTDEEWNSRITLCLDGIQDPGNMGTIIRLADWFGFSHLVCSNDTADVFNPKVVQASMGAIGRVKVIYTHLPEFCQLAREKYSLPVLGTYMDGENIYSTNLPSKGLIIMGNEGSGIRTETEQMVTRRLTIPAFSEDSTTGMESLNVGVATAVVCSEFKRQQHYSDYSK